MRQLYVLYEFRLLKYLLYTFAIQCLSVCLITWNCLRSQTFSMPSSPPDSMNGSLPFQCMTFTSRSCASTAVSIQALLGAARLSQIRILRSTEHEANTWKRGASIRNIQAKPLWYQKRWCCFNIPANIVMCGLKIPLFSLYSI